MDDDALPPRVHGCGLDGRGTPAVHHPVLIAADGRPGSGPGWLDEIPFGSGPPVVRIGTRRIAEADWLLRDGHLDEELRAKADLLRRRPAEVIAVDESDPDREKAEAATLASVEDWLARHDPVPGRGHPPSQGPSALVTAAGLVAEDLCLVRVGDGPPTLVSAVVCSPSYWRLTDKIGRPMAAIHEPVPDYEEDLGERPDRLLEGLEGERIVARRNWMVHDGGVRFAPTRPPPAALPAAEAADRLWLRSERQTLRAVPGTDHVLFTIRVQQAPLAVLRDRPEIRARLAAAIRAEGEERTDRIAAAHVAPTLAWLASPR